MGSSRTGGGSCVAQGDKDERMHAPVERAMGGGCWGCTCGYTPRGEWRTGRGLREREDRGAAADHRSWQSPHQTHTTPIALT